MVLDKWVRDISRSYISDGRHNGRQIADTLVSSGHHLYTWGHAGEVACFTNGELDWWGLVFNSAALQRTVYKAITFSSTLICNRWLCISASCCFSGHSPLLKTTFGFQLHHLRGCWLPSLSSSPSLVPIIWNCPWFN